MVKNLSANAGDAGSIPGQGTKIPHAAGLLSPCTSTREHAHHNYRAHLPWSPHATTRERPMHRNRKKIPHATTRT